jgi:hypothetical protein
LRDRVGYAPDITLNAALDFLALGALVHHLDPEP